MKNVTNRSPNVHGLKIFAHYMLKNYPLVILSKIKQMQVAVQFLFST